MKTQKTQRKVVRKPWRLGHLEGHVDSRRLGPPDPVGGFEIGDGSRHAQHFVVSPGGEAKLFHRGFQDAHGLGLEPAELAKLAWGHAAVDQRAVLAEALGLASTRGQHLGARVTGGSAGGQLGKLREGDGGDLDVQIDAVQKRTGDLAQVLPPQESFASLAHTNPTRQRGL